MTHIELDWPGALKLAGRFCSTERGGGAMLLTEPSADPTEVDRRLGITRDLCERRQKAPPLLIGGLDEAAPLLARLGPVGRALAPEDLLDLFVLIERSEGARGAASDPELATPYLAELLRPLTDFSDLLSERTRIFEPDGRIKDDATARLFAIRTSIVRIRRDVVKRLEEFGRSRSDSLADGYVTEKGGRYCLPVRSDRREGVAGIVHEKSGSGQTLFVEPLAIVEVNNALAEALEEEREEVHRILVALTARFSQRKADLAASVAVLTELDVCQARAEISQRMDGTFPVFGDRLHLVGARHPLLDRRLAPLREEVFGEDSEKRHSDAVPLDISLPEGKRMLLVSGPNAGGKSVAMKTVGLFSLLAQSGFALPAAQGSTLPIFDKVLIVAGDAQDLLGDLSSFAAAMTRTARVLAQATPGSLVLLDELGSGTDPEEGSALAAAILEADRRRGGFTVATTHLSAVKEWAHSQPDVLAAAMEFDETHGKPTFRLCPGATGRSRALATAEKAGIPRSVLESARGRLGAGWARTDAALERLERETLLAQKDREAAQEASRAADSLRLTLERDRAALTAERARLKEKTRTELDRAVEALREKTRRELDRLREESRSGKTIGKNALTVVTQAARAEAESLLESLIEEPGPGAPPVVGGMVSIRPFRTTGRLISIDEAKGQAEVETGGKRLRVSLDSVSALAVGSPGPKAKVPGRIVPGPSPKPQGTVSPGAPVVSTSEIVLVGFRVDDALPEVERALNDALMAGKGALRVVHGFGTGRLAAAIREFLSEHPGVRSHRPGEPTEGGGAATIALLDV